MKYFIGALTAIIVIVIGLLIFIYSGIYNISAADKHTGVTLWMINTLKDNSVKHHTDQKMKVPDLSDTSLVNTGFRHYKEMCVGCHGAPGIDKMAKGFYPNPPLLIRAAADWNARELYWIIKNGIKMSAMPAFGATHTDQMIWAMVAFTQKVPKMTKEEYQNFQSQFP